MDLVKNALVFLFILAVLGTSACASKPQKTGEEEIAAPSSSASKDPLEKVNRAIFKFNDTADTWVLKPMAKGYKYMMPDPMETGVSNFFSNLEEVSNVVNNLLQWKWKKVGNSSGRLLMNSTIGIVGLFDVAKHAGLEKKESESFGQTLTYWGVPAGPYLVIPFTGPSTLTDLVGSPVDYVLDPIYHIDESGERYVLVGLRILDTRASLLNAEELISGDKYSFVRDAFLQRRDYLVKDGEVEDEFGGDFGDFGEEF